MRPVKNILGIGAGYAAASSMAVPAGRCGDLRVTVVDVGAVKIRAGEGARLPIFEPGPERIVKRTRGRNHFLSEDIPGGIRQTDMIFVCVNTPTGAFGYGAGHAWDLQHMEKTARMILRGRAAGWKGIGAFRPGRPIPQVAGLLAAAGSGF